MKIRMCPLCDSEMKKRHYCDACHSFVWKPEMADIHLNTEARGLGEEDCAYTSDGHHADGSDRYRTDVSDGYRADSADRYDTGASDERYVQDSDGQWRYGTGASGRIQTHQKQVWPKMAQPKVKQQKMAHVKKKTQHMQWKYTVSGQKNGGGKKRSAVSVIIGVIVVMVLAVKVAEMITGDDIEDMIYDIRDLVTDGKDTGVFGDEDETAYETGYKTLTHEEVMAGGVPCNGFQHLDISGVEVYDRMLEFARERGDVSTENADAEDSYETNDVYMWDTGDTTYYETDRMYYSDDDSVYVEVKYDTYNSQLHGIFMTFSHVEDAMAYLSCGMEIAGTGADTGAWRPDSAAELFDFDSTDEDYKFVDYGDVEIYTSVNEYGAGKDYVVEISAQ